MAGAGAALAVPEMVTWVGESLPFDKPTVTAPEYAPTAAGVIVTVTPHVAPAASVVLLQVSTEVAMIEGWDKVNTPTISAVAFGLANVRSTVVDWPTLTVAAVTVVVAIINGDPAIPVSPTVVVTPAVLVGTDNVAEWLPAAVGA